MCLVAAGRLDGMLSLRAVRSVDVAAGWLIVREAGGVVELPDVDAPASLGLESALARGVRRQRRRGWPAARRGSMSRCRD